MEIANYVDKVTAGKRDLPLPPSFAEHVKEPELRASLVVAFRDCHHVTGARSLDGRCEHVVENALPPIS